MKALMGGILLLAFAVWMIWREFKKIQKGQCCGHD